MAKAPPHRFSPTILPSPMTTHPSKSRIRFLPSEERGILDNVKQVLTPRTSSLMCLLKEPVRREHVVKSPPSSPCRNAQRINLHTDRLFPNPVVSRSVVHVAVAVRRWPNQDALLQVKNKVKYRQSGVEIKFSSRRVGRLPGHLPQTACA
jgi:hypothetical protein